jgi:hypothetical protein
MERNMTDLKNFKPLDNVIFRCPHKGEREVIVLNQLKNGDVWIGDSLVKNGKQKVKPNLLRLMNRLQSEQST